MYVHKTNELYGATMYIYEKYPNVVYLECRLKYRLKSNKLFYSFCV